MGGVGQANPSVDRGVRRLRQGEPLPEAGRGARRRLRGLSGSDGDAPDNL